jgi:hypothetical protein
LKLTAKKHALAAHDRLKFPCPRAEAENCGKMFSSFKSANRHAKLHGHPYPCQHAHCQERFVTAKDAIDHSYDPKHSLETLFQCAIPDCRSAISGKKFTAGAFGRHWQKHIELGDVETVDESVASPVDTSPAYSQLPLFLSILERGCIFLGERTAADDGDVDDDDDDDAPGTNESNNWNLDDSDAHGRSEENDEDQEEEILASWEEQEVFNGVSTTAFSEEHRLQIHKSNTIKWSMFLIYMACLREANKRLLEQVVERFVRWAWTIFDASV